MKTFFSMLYACGSAMGRLGQAQARWDLETSRIILARRKKLLLLVTSPIVLFLILQTAAAADLPVRIPILGGSQAYMPSSVNAKMFCGSILVGLLAGLITGVIGAGGGYILTPALMSFGVRGIMAVGTDQFHLFAKAIMGTTIHRKLGNVNTALAAWFVAGSFVGVTAGGTISRAIFQYNPTLSDVMISTVYVVVLGILAIYAIADWRRLGRRGAEAVEATTGMAKWLQALPLSPRVRFDHDIVPGGRSIAVYPIIVCGFVVGFVASIMGVGGGFLTFPMFVYGLGVSTFTTVGTDILQIIFTTLYSSVFQYAIYGFVFYTVAIGMLLGSLVGVQIGALITKVVKGAEIRAFYALTILAGFVNRACALPRKLADMGVVSLPRSVTGAIERAGTVAFFAIVGIFALWILYVFVKQIDVLRDGQAGLIVDRRRFRIGLAGLVTFFVVLAVTVSPVVGGKTGLEWADNMLNQLAKNSAYFGPEGEARAAAFAGQAIDLGISPRDPADSSSMITLLGANGLDASVTADGRVRMRGDLGQLAQAALADADLAYKNREQELAARYGMSATDAIYHWWTVFSGLTQRYTQENRSAEAGLTKFITTRVLEPAYNFRGIEAANATEHAPLLALLLGFYVVYTLWYGFSILYLCEGLGIGTSRGGEKKEA